MKTTEHPELERIHRDELSSPIPVFHCGADFPVRKSGNSRSCVWLSGCEDVWDEQLRHLWNTKIQLRAGSSFIPVPLLHRE